MKEKLEKAIKEKDPADEVWKFKRTTDEDGNIQQNEIRLGDATDDQLKTFAQHCGKMLWNTDKKYPGRYVLNDLIDKQRNLCNTELFIRWVERSSYTKNKQDPTKAPFMRTQFLQDLMAYLDSPVNKERYPSSKYYELPIDQAFVNYPVEFNDVKIGNVIDGCLDRLGTFDSRHLSLKFITKIGLWFTPAEVEDLTEKDPDSATGGIKNRLQVIHERLRLHKSIILHTCPTGIGYQEFRAMVSLVRHYSPVGFSGDKKYSDMTSKQLETLRDKVLLLLKKEVCGHITQWEQILGNIRKVALTRGIEIDEKGNIIKDTPSEGMCPEMDSK